MADPRFVIVGAGLAGAKTAEALREQAFDGSIVVVGDEAERPYERPPLSKELLAGTAEPDSVYVHPETWYAEHDVELRTGLAVAGIDRSAHHVRLADGSTLNYTKLALATGSRARPLPVPGADAENVHYLRRLGDSQAIKKLMGSVRRLVVVGGGWIGLEVAAVARDAGVAVTVVETRDLPLESALGPELARVFADLHAEHGVQLRTGVDVERVSIANGRATGVRLADGTEVPADAVVVGIGAIPNTELAAEAGLAVDDGVLVDESLRTADPDIVAVGDIALAQHPLLGRSVRVEHWANALNQPAVAAAAMLGRPGRYEELPYFFTDQYDLGMEYHGLAEPGSYDQVVFRGERDRREFIAFWLRERRVVAGMNVNIWDVDEPIKALIRDGVPVDPERLANVDIPLDEVRTR